MRWCPGRRSDVFLLALAAGGALLVTLVLRGEAVSGRVDGGLAERARLVAELGLTDLCLFPEARYTRHPSQADLHAPFQDCPLAQEHFPAGSLLGPRRPWPPKEPPDAR